MPFYYAYFISYNVLHLASILFPIHWLARLVNILILIHLMHTLAKQVTWNSAHLLHL